MKPSCLWAGIALTLGACVQTQSPAPVSEAATQTRGCRTASAMIAFDFEGASASTCAIDGEREFSVLVAPEHVPPINPSPWYAFQYTATGGEHVVVHLRYLGAKHRYRPKWRSGSQSKVLDVALRDEGQTASLSLPSGQGTVSAQELIGAAEYDALMARLGRSAAVSRVTLGRSHDGRLIEALRIGNPAARNLVILLGRQHPPEVSGAIAMEHFLEESVSIAESGQLAVGDIQILAVPLLNPDGVAHGYWRSNRGGLDINRDWGAFTQPETRSVANWLAQLPPLVRPVAMLDFHSTARNLFYVQGDEASAAEERFLARWLGGQENRTAGYSFTIERRNANPNSGTAKNWFHAAHAIPAYTYEVGDETDRRAIAESARELARTFFEALPDD